MADIEAPMFFNLNYYICARLTPHGREVHRQNRADQYAHYGALIDRGDMPPPKAGWPPEYIAPKEEPDGWSEWQAWDFMNEFGRAMGNGRPLPVETTIFVGSMAQLRVVLSPTPPHSPAEGGEK